MQEELERERDQCRRLVDAEKREVAAAKDKLTAQLAQLKSSSEQVITPVVYLVLRLTVLSRPNKVDLKCPSVRSTSARPSAKSFFDFNEIWRVGRV